MLIQKLQTTLDEENMAQFCILNGISSANLPVLRLAIQVLERTIGGISANFNHRQESTKLGAVTALLGLFIALPSHSGELQNIEEIRDGVESYILGNSPGDSETEVSVSPLDSRLRLQKCDKDLTYEWATQRQSAGNVTVKVSCDSSNPWSFFVNARIHREVAVVVASRNLRRGEILSEADVRIDKRRLDSLHGPYIEEPEIAVGLELKRHVSTGDLITKSQVAQPMLIKRGQQVTINARFGQISVSTPGEALSNGRLGEYIRVKNLKSKRIVQGVVNSAGHIDVY